MADSHQRRSYLNEIPFTFHEEPSMESSAKGFPVLQLAKADPYAFKQAANQLFRGRLRLNGSQIWNHRIRTSRMLKKAIQRGRSERGGEAY